MFLLFNQPPGLGGPVSLHSVTQILWQFSQKGKKNWICQQIFLLTHCNRATYSIRSCFQSDKTSHHPCRARSSLCSNAGRCTKILVKIAAVRRKFRRSSRFSSRVQHQTACSLQTIDPAISHSVNAIGSVRRVDCGRGRAEICTITL